MWDGENFKFLNFGTDFDTFLDEVRAVHNWGRVPAVHFAQSGTD